MRSNPITDANSNGSSLPSITISRSPVLRFSRMMG